MKDIQFVADGQYYILCIEIYKGCSFNKIHISLLIFNLSQCYGECLKNYGENSNSKNNNDITMKMDIYLFLLYIPYQILFNDMIQCNFLSVSLVHIRIKTDLSICGVKYRYSQQK